MGVIRLPIPILTEGNRIRDVETKSKVVTSVIADTTKVMEKGDNYRGIQTFIAGGLEKIGSVSDKQGIYALVGKMAYKSAWLVAVKLLMQDEKDDGVEGLYICPRCQEKKVCEFNEDKELDTRDYLSDLVVRYMEDGDPSTVVHKLESPVSLIDEDKNEQIIEKLELDFPTLNHCSKAFGKYGDRDEIRLQLAVFVQALRKVNDDEVDDKFKTMFGMYIFEHMDKNDTREITKKTEIYGLDTRVQKSCNKCGKKFEVNLSTANFFVGALH